MVLNTKFTIPTAIEYLRSVVTIRSDWSSKTPLQKWAYFYGIGKIPLDMIGFPIFNSDQRLQWKTYLGHVFFITIFIMSGYTIGYYLLFQGDILAGLPSTCILAGPVVASLPFLFLVTSAKRHTVHAWMDYGGTYVFPHKHEDRKYIEISSKIIDRSMRSFMTRFLVMLGAFIIGMIRIFYANIFLNIKTTVIELKIPFIEANSDAEFAVNFVLQSLMLLYALLGYIGMEVAMELTILPGYATPKLVEHEFRKLDRKIEESCFDEMQVRLTFRNILLQMMDYDNIVIEVSDGWYWRSFAAPIGFSYSIAMSIYCEFTKLYMFGYCAAFISYVQLFFLCAAAETLANDGSSEILYNTKWYGLPIELQKDLMHLINRRQNRTALAIGPFTELSIETFFAITKKIYSFIMFLLNVFK